MATKYPIVLAHGIILKDYKFFKAFGRIEKVLGENGYTAYTSETDGFGTIENNAAQLKRQIERILEEDGAEKVNIIAHSKGGLDTRCMIESLGMGEKVASVTFLCTPHKGSQIATKLYEMRPRRRDRIAGWLNFWYRIFGDENPDALAVCKQLSASDEDLLGGCGAHDGIFMQSYSTVQERRRDDFVMGIPLHFSRIYENDFSDGLVSVESSKFAEYKGHCTDHSISHSEIVDFMASKKKKEKIYAFYLELCKDLADRGC